MMELLTDIYKQVISRDNLYASARAAAKGKRFKNAVSRFNFLHEWEINRLRHDLFNKTYRHGAYWLFKILDPKEREIAVSPFRDRVVHHAIHDVIEPVIDKTFIFDSYACRKGKGTHKALERAQSFLRANKYCLHGDIKKYFFSVDHAVLKKIVRLKIKDMDLLDLIDKVIDSANNVAVIQGKGLPIGNLTSQFFANLYLNEFDRFMKFTLKQRYYIRYMDDFLLFSNDLDQLKDMREQARGFLKDKLCLTMHEPKSQIFKTIKGIKFLGLRLFEGHRRLDSNNVRRLRGRFHFVKHDGLRSWFAYSQNADTVLLRKNILCSASKLLRLRPIPAAVGLGIILWLGLASSAWAQYLGGSGTGDTYGRYPSALLATTGQTFSLGSSSTSAGTIEVMQDTVGAGTGITTSSGIKIDIPSGLNMIWDSSITTATISGSASGDVSTTVSYANSNTTLVITVTSNFSDGNYILVSGVNFKSFTSAGTGQLMLDIGATYGYDADNSLQEIAGAPIYYLGGNGDGHALYDFQTQQGQLSYGSEF